MSVVSPIIRIDEIQRVEDYWWLRTDIYFICIYNPVFFEDSSGNQTELSAAIAESIKGIVAQVSIGTEWVVFLLEDGCKLKVSIKDEDYVGPEAMQFAPHDNDASYVII